MSLISHETISKSLWVSIFVFSKFKLVDLPLWSLNSLTDCSGFWGTSKREQVSVQTLLPLSPDRAALYIWYFVYRASVWSFLSTKGKEKVRKRVLFRRCSFMWLPLGFTPLPIHGGKFLIGQSLPYVSGCPCSPGNNRLWWSTFFESRWVKK